MHFIGTEYIPPDISLEYCKKHGSEKVLGFLKAADFAIEIIEVNVKEFSPEQLPKDMPKSFATFLTDEMKGQKQFDAKMVHKTEDGESFPMPLDWESDGTQRMLALAEPFLETLKYGRILMVDELNQRLHPYLMRYLIELFNNPETNPNNAQLIFTTHAVSLLKDDIFRRDQIWFCERDKNQAATLFPLAEFEEGKGYEDFEAYYMTGRYGAVPFIGDFSNTIDKKADE